MAFSAQVGQMRPGRDRVPGRSEPALQGPVSALCTEGQHVGVLSVGGDMVCLQHLPLGGHRQEGRARRWVKAEGCDRAGWEPQTCRALRALVSGRRRAER